MKNRVCAMMQPNYIPWKGFFDLISLCDVFVFYDDVQYTKRDWRNRNKIKTKDGTKWLSVPVISNGKQLIKDTIIDNGTDWKTKHYKTILGSYQKAPNFKFIDSLLEDLYLNQEWENLSEMNIEMTKKISAHLGIHPEWVKASDLNCHGEKDGEKVIQICKKIDCNYFINGPASKSFMNSNLFESENITLDYIDYTYSEYDQLYPPFDHFVTILDTLSHVGPDFKKYIFQQKTELGLSK